MSTIYVVASGTYSSYGINCVFSSRQLAEAYCEEYNRGDVHFDKAEIEEYEVDQESAAKTVVCYGASIVLRTGELNPTDRKLRFIDSSEIGPAESWHNFAFAYSEESQEHANKLAVEKRQRWLRDNPAECTVR